MRHFLIIGGALAALTTASYAADMPSYPAEAAVAAPFDWTGFYVGAHVGGAWGEENDNLSVTVGDPPPEIDPEPPADNFDIDGVIGGVHAGYNIQSGSFVFGIEGDFDGSGVEGDAEHLGYSPELDETLDGVLSLEQDWMASVRGRLGLAFDRSLIYVTGGVAFTQATLTYEGVVVDNAIPDFSFSDDQTHIGWTVGGGFEYAFTDNWTGRIEGRFTEFDSETYEFETGPVEVDFHVGSVTAGISYRF